MTQKLPLSGRRALITGAAQGIGFGIAERLHADGAEIIIADLNEAAAVSAAAKIGSSGPKVTSFAVDVAKPDSVIALHKAVGDIDILINNAGIFQDTHILEAAEELWKKSYEINVFGIIRCIQAFAPGMVKAKWGRIINMGSLLSHVAYGRDLGYAGSKTAVLGITRSVAADLAPYGISVNTVAPGNINTQMMVDVAKVVEERDGLEKGSFMKARADAIPSKRLGEPSDIAAAVAFLCRDDAGYVNGQTLNVNGALYYH